MTTGNDEESDGFGLVLFVFYYFVHGLQYGLISKKLVVNPSSVPTSFFLLGIHQHIRLAPEEHSRWHLKSSSRIVTGV